MSVKDIAGREEKAKKKIAQGRAPKKQGPPFGEPCINLVLSF
jgi:hypothetical protein